MSFRKILCPIDFSVGSKHALKAAALLAGERAELEIFHAFSLPPIVFATEVPPPPELIDSELRIASEALAAAVIEARLHGATRVTSRMVRGATWSTIVEALANPTFELCVIGTRGHTGLARVLLGSVAEKVVRHAPCTVLVVHPDDRLGALQNILCPTDFTPSSSHAIELASKLLAPGGTLTLLHVLDLADRFTGRTHVDPTIASIARASLEIASQRAEWLRGPSRTIRTASCVGNPGAQILEAIDRDPSIDLVAIGTHGRTGLMRVLGSVAEKIVRHATCPVLVARSRE